MATQSTKTLSLKTRIVWENKIAEENFAVFTEYAPFSKKWRTNAIKMEDARFNKHFSQAEHNEILAFRQAPLPIGISSAIMDTGDAMFVNSNPVVSVAPVIFSDDEKTNNSKNVSAKFKSVIQNSWYESLGSLQYARAIFDSGNVGHGLLYAVPRNEYGEFFVDVKHISWKYFFPDPSSRDILYDDMDNQVYAKPITLKQAYRFVKSIEPDLTFEQFKKEWKGDGTGSASLGFFSEDSAMMGGLKTDESVLFIQRVALEDQAYFLIIPKSDKFGEAGFRYSSVMELTDDILKQQNEGLIRVEPKRKLCLTEYTSIGNYGYKVSYPISHRNIIPIVNQYKDSPYPYSRMWYLYPLQRALNRAIMSSLLNMSLLNATRVIAEEGSIINLKEWVTNASMPGVALRYRLPIPGISTPPQVVEPKPMGEAWLTFPKFLISMMEYTSGMFGFQQGNNEKVPDAFGSMATLQSISNQRIKMKGAMNDASLSRLGQVMGEFFKEYAPPEGYSSHRDPIEDTDTITRYNSLQINKKEVGDGLPPKISIDIDPNTDLKTGFKDVRFTTQASLGNESITEASLLATMGTQGNMPELIKMALSKLNIRGLDKALQNMDENGQLRGQMAQMENTIKDLDSATKQYQNQIFALAQGLTAAQAKGKLDVELTKFKSNPVGYLNQATTNQGEH